MTHIGERSGEPSTCDQWGTLRPPPSTGLNLSGFRRSGPAVYSFVRQQFGGVLWNSGVAMFYKLAVSTPRWPRLNSPNRLKHKEKIYLARQLHLSLPEELKHGALAPTRVCTPMRPETTIRFACAMILVATAMTGPALATPISATLNGTIDGINGGTTSAIGVDVAGIVALGDSATITIEWDPALATFSSGFGTTRTYLGAILGIDASLNGGALSMSYDPLGGSSLNLTWISTSGFTGFNPVDFDGDGNAGALTGNVISTSDPVFTTDWHPLQFVVQFAPVADNTVVPSMPDFTSARLDWRALRPGASQQSGITMIVESVQFGTTVPEPGTLSILSVGLAALTLLRRKRTDR